MKRFKISFYIISALLLLYIVCIAHKSIHTIFVDGDKYRQRVSELNDEKVDLQPLRGFIFADNQELLAGSLPEYDVSLDFYYTTIPDAKGKVNIPTDTIEKYFSAKGPGSVALAELRPEKTATQYGAEITKARRDRKKAGHSLFHALPYLDYQKLKTLPYFSKRSALNGLVKKERANRYRPYGETRMGASTIGSVYAKHKDKNGILGVGRGGIEQAYDSLLKGTIGSGHKQTIRRRVIEVTHTQPENGANVHTTLNVEMQDILDRALAKRIIELNAVGGWSAVMEVKTGKIKAIANLKRYGDSVCHEDYNHFVEDLYDPGSTFKTFSYMVLLDEGKISPDSLIDTKNTREKPGSWFCHTKEIKDDHPVGIVSAHKAIVESSNIAIAKLTYNAYKNDQQAYLNALEERNVFDDLELKCDFPGAQHPRKRSTQERTWSKVSLAQLSYGYENQIPPIYILNFYNAIANDGKLMRPYIVDWVEKDGETYYEREPEVINSRICKKSTLNAIQQALRDVVLEGTARSINSDKVEIAGKTGTAQRYDKGSYSYQNGHYVSFAGYFPADEPEYSCLVVIQIKPPYRGRPGGGYMAGPVFKQFAEEVYAIHCHRTLRDIGLDSLHAFSPQVKNGPLSETDFILDRLDLDTLKYDIKDLSNITAGIVPDVKGMGAEEALYLLERHGLKVSLQGYGTVVSQSLKANSHYRNGDYIRLTLK